MLPKTFKEGAVLDPLHIEVTEQMVKKYGDVSGDFNPIHFDDSAAQEKGFPGKIIHGMLSMAIASTIVEPLTQRDYWVKTYDMKFRAPVLVGETITITGTILALETDTVTIDLLVSNPTYPQVAKGRILLHVYK
ncbi:MaoC family dehydratase N-terminal domain-containing protein [Fictibacillus nanhaiensis]|uniref:MaoC family dehydratase n=1 Tax=Fictibacillus nanhaiensis TaxID=742169 RepID=UPI00203DAA21|nr:MaoC/PaaZ C-terminal domain-containing protein [Fictibacillus nanhaiensis]MCM3731659.1 MaoC family dehydratase N-terminal domain-containing protein [Fictibacillus nanhaiensis]